MENSNKNIYQRLLDFHGDVEAIQKTSLNAFYNKKYADINSVLAAIMEPLRKNGLLLIQYVRETYVETVIINVDNPEERQSCIVPLLECPTMQELGKAITYSRRYGIVTLLVLTQDDDDANYSVVAPAQTAAPKPVRAAPVTSNSPSQPTTAAPKPVIAPPSKDGDYIVELDLTNCKIYENVSPKTGNEYRKIVYGDTCYFVHDSDLVPHFHSGDHGMISVICRSQGGYQNIISIQPPEVTSNIPAIVPARATKEYDDLPF